MLVHSDAKAMAKSLRAALAERGQEIPHSAALEIVARQFGLPSWNVLSARIDGAADKSAGTPFAFEQAIPIVRIFDVVRHDVREGQRCNGECCLLADAAPLTGAKREVGGLARRPHTVRRAAVAH